MSRLVMRSIASLGLIASLLATGCPGAGDPGAGTPVASMIVEGVQSGSDTCQTPGNEAALRSRVIELVNQERTSRGLAAVTLNEQLNQMAADYCCDMIEERFFGHTDPYTGEEPGQRALEAGYIYLAVGENLAGGQTSPEQVMAEWMASPPHRQNVLAAQWREAGLAVSTGGEYGVYWVLEFGNPP